MDMFSSLRVTEFMSCCKHSLLRRDDGSGSSFICITSPFMSDKFSGVVEGSEGSEGWVVLGND